MLSLLTLKFLMMVYLWLFEARLLVIASVVNKWIDDSYNNIRKDINGKI